MLKGILKGVVRMGLKPVLRPGVSVTFQRRWVGGLTATMLPPRGTRASALNMDGVPGERVTVGEAADGIAVLYLHGGGYCVGSPPGYRVITGRLAKNSGAAAYVPDYRLAPEHPHPAALDDALRACRWLRKQGASRVAFAGDSAGAGLALATALKLRDAGESLPVALALISPWVDLAARGESMRTHAQRDPMLSPEGLARWAREYLGDLPADHPFCSPLYADLRGLPPMLIQVGSEEVALSDAQRLHERAGNAGVDAQLHEFPGLWHDFQLHAGLLGESDAALAELGAFLHRHLDVT